MADRTCVDCDGPIPKTNRSRTPHCPDCCADFMRAAGVEPLEPYRANNVPWRCRCLRCGGEVSPRYANVQQGHGACDHCGRRSQAKARRMSEAEAVAVMLAAGLQPLEPYASSQTQWRCRCLACGTEVTPRYGNIASGWGGCPDCAYRQRGLACRKRQADAVAIMKRAGMEPLEPYRRKDIPWLCRCIRCGRETTPTFNNVRSGHGGCVECAGMKGFIASRAALVYLIQHPGHDATKIGVTNLAGNRFAQHRRQGWHVVLAVRVPGVRALAIEAGIISWWRRGLGLPPYLGREEMPQGGWTETVASSGIDLAATIRRINRGTWALTGISAQGDGRKAVA